MDFWLYYHLLKAEIISLAELDGNQTTQIKLTQINWTI